MSKAVQNSRNPVTNSAGISLDSSFFGDVKSYMCRLIKAIKLWITLSAYVRKAGYTRSLDVNGNIILMNDLNSPFPPVPSVFFVLFVVDLTVVFIRIEVWQLASSMPSKAEADV